MTELVVRPVGTGTFRVEVVEGGSTSTHEVTVGGDDLARLSGGHPADRLVEASFRFLLEREPKESILPAFDLASIERYFPEYPSRIGGYL